MIILVNLTNLDEIAFLFEEYRAFYKQEPDPIRAREFLKARIQSNESVIYGFKEENQLIGFTQLYPSYSSTRMKRIWILNDLFVLPEHRGKGISKKLIDAAKDLAISTNAAGLLLETAKTNDIGNSLYPATGFHLESDTNFYWWTAPGS
ncbi:MAG: GNAT family N-acetyltransferase [Chitinophagaceae bacterium]|nr:GNAT family N-acetyltransferase [Chitinophagaceae bacterium]